MVPTVVVPVMTLGNCVFLPQQLMPLRIFEPRYRKMLKETLAGSRMFAISQLDEDSLSPDNDHAHPRCRRHHLRHISQRPHHSNQRQYGQRHRRPGRQREF